MDGNYVQAIWSAGTTIGLDLVPGQVIGRVNGGDFGIVGPPDGYAGPSHIRSAAHDQLFYTTLGSDRTRVFVVREDGTNDVFLEGESYDVAMFRTDGEDLVWSQSYERSSITTYERNELWTAPFSSDPSAIDGRKLLDLGSGVASSLNLRVGSGYAAVEQSAQQILLVRLSDGAWWTLEAPADHRWFGPPRYITNDELAVVVGQGRYHRTVFRIAIDSLGAPSTEPYTP